TYWQGLTNDAAARRLGWPPGTLKARLARARAILRGRLTARGVTLPAGAAALLLAPGGAAAALPPGLIAATARAVFGGAAGTTSGAAALAGGSWAGMTLARPKCALALLLTLGAVALAAGGLGQPRPEGSTAGGPAAKPAGVPRLDLA